MQGIQMEVESGSIIQANENSGDWCGCLLIVDEVKSWGVQAYMMVPKKGTAFIRLNNDEFDLVGKAVLVIERSDD